MKPANIDNPIMQIAFRDFVMWAHQEQGMRSAFQDHTGICLEKKLSPIEQMVDDATGKMEADLQAFVDWLIEFRWGAENANECEPETPSPPGDGRLNLTGASEVLDSSPASSLNDTGKSDG